MFRIFTDTSSNLDSELLKRKNVSVVPFSYYVNGEEHTCLDTHAFNGSGYYDAIRNGVRVTTSQVPPQRYIDAMTPVLAGGEDVLFVGMSSGISGAYSAAEMAAGRLLEQFPERKIRLVDTLSASLAEGIVVLHAIELREEGKSLDETADELMELRHSVCQIFTVEDLRYLRMGGRLPLPHALHYPLVNGLAKKKRPRWWRRGQAPSPRLRNIWCAALRPASAAGCRATRTAGARTLKAPRHPIRKQTAGKRSSRNGARPWAETPSPKHAARSSAGCKIPIRIPQSSWRTEIASRYRASFLFSQASCGHRKRR